MTNQESGNLVGGQHRRALYAGSFDPPTNGHTWVIEQGSRLFPELHVAIGVNPDKKPLFTVEERVEMLEHSLQHLGNVSVGLFEGKYLVDYAQEIGGNALLRGLRTPEDLNMELTIAAVNRDIAPDITTAYVACPSELAIISSSLVKGLVGPENWEQHVGRYVSPFVLEALRKKEALKKKNGL